MSLSSVRAQPIPKVSQGRQSRSPLAPIPTLCVSTTRRRATSLETEDRAEQGPVHAHIKSEQVGTAALVVVNI